MKAIITRARPDGTFDAVGMANRAIISGSNRNIRRKARHFASGRPVRIEYYTGTIQDQPIKVEVLK